MDGSEKMKNLLFVTIFVILSYGCTVKNIGYSSHFVDHNEPKNDGFEKALRFENDSIIGTKRNGFALILDKYQQKNFDDNISGEHNFFSFYEKEFKTEDMVDSVVLSLDNMYLNDTVVMNSQELLGYAKHSEKEGDIILSRSGENVIVPNMMYSNIEDNQIRGVDKYGKFLEADRLGEVSNLFESKHKEETLSNQNQSFFTKGSIPFEDFYSSNNKKRFSNALTNSKYRKSQNQNQQFNPNYNLPSNSSQNLSSGYNGFDSKLFEDRWNDQFNVVEFQKQNDMIFSLMLQIEKFQNELVLLKDQSNVYEAAKSYDSVQLDSIKVNKKKFGSNYFIDTSDNRVSILERNLPVSEKLFTDEEFYLNKEVENKDVFIAYYKLGRIQPADEKAFLLFLNERIGNDNIRKITLSGFTDSSGNANLNKRVTNKRLNYLLSKIIPMITQEQVESYNFGDKFASEMVVQEERRVEIKVYLR